MEIVARCFSEVVVVAVWCVVCWGEECELRESKTTCNIHKEKIEEGTPCFALDIALNKKPCFASYMQRQTPGNTFERDAIRHQVAIIDRKLCPWHVCLVRLEFHCIEEET